MKKCPPARLPYLGLSSSALYFPSAIRRPLSSLRREFLGRTSIPPNRRQWSRQFSDSPAPIDNLSLQRYFRGILPKLPVDESRKQDPNAWIPLLEKRLTSALPNRPYKLPEQDSGSQNEGHTPGHELAALLNEARYATKQDLLAHLGFRLNRWSDVHALLSELLDAVDALHAVTTPLRPPSNLDWGGRSGISLDELTTFPIGPEDVGCSRNTESPYLDQLTKRSYARDLAQSYMAEVWQSLGSIVLQAADMPPNESKLAMSYVFQILARLHHSGAISDKVYSYTRPDSHDSIFRPPGIHLLSTHIMSVLSDAAWLVHEADVAAKASSAGEESPFLPFKMSVRTLGPEVWLELILWCCIEHGHVREGIWLLEQMKTRTNGQAWKFQSWKPLLQRSDLVWKTNIDSEDFWRHPDHETTRASRRRRNPSSAFHGLGKRTISAEVVSSLRDNLANFVYLGLGFFGSSPRHILHQFSRLDSISGTTNTNDEKLQPTTKASNNFIVRVIESGGLEPEVDPHAFERLLRYQPHIVPPWNAFLPVQDVEQTTLSQLYDETSALAGLIEYNVQSFASNKQTGPAFITFSWLQEVIDLTKSQRIDRFFEHMSADSPPLFNVRNKPFESTLPQVSDVTFAHLLELATASQEYAFGEWLLLSQDVDGPPIHPSSYENQALSPSILRYAVATKNDALCNQLISSLSRPLSLNTLRELLNFRIATGDFERVLMMLNYLGEHRLKSWGHSNVTMLAGTILKLDRSQRRNGTDEKQKSLDKAKYILLQILNGKFKDKSSSIAMHGNLYQQRALVNLHRVFMSIPGPLREIAEQAKLPYKATPHDATPFIPTAAFHKLLSAVVDILGSAAGKILWDRWCLEPMSPASRRLHEGGIFRLYLHEERDPKRGDPHFDPSWLKELQRKAVIPDLNTVRIIAQAALKEAPAVKEQPPARSEATNLPEKDDDLDRTRLVIKNIHFAVKRGQFLQLMTEMNLPLPLQFNYYFDNGIFKSMAFARFNNATEAAVVIKTLNNLTLNRRGLAVEYKKMSPEKPSNKLEHPAEPPLSNPQFSHPAEEVLYFCLQQFKNLRLPDEEIDRETGGYLTRLKKSGIDVGARKDDEPELYYIEFK